MSEENPEIRTGTEREREKDRRCSRARRGVARETRRGVPLILRKLIIVQLRKNKRLAAQTEVRKQ